MKTLLGTIRLGREIGHAQEGHRFAWVECPHCRERRWSDMQPAGRIVNNQRGCLGCWRKHRARARMVN